MSGAIWFRMGEATVFSSEGQGADAMPEILIGSVKGPAGTAFANLMGQTEGHTRMFAILPIDVFCRTGYRDVLAVVQDEMLLAVTLFDFDAQPVGPVYGDLSALAEFNHLAGFLEHIVTVSEIHAELRGLG